VFHRNRVVDTTLEFDEVKILLRVIFFVLVNIKFLTFCNCVINSDAVQRKFHLNSRCSVALYVAIKRFRAMRALDASHRNYFRIYYLACIVRKQSTVETDFEVYPYSLRIKTKQWKETVEYKFNFI